MDKDLHDDMLKLVRYKVLFVKRDYEYAFPEQEALVSDNMDSSAFTAWKIAEFIQTLGKGPDPKTPERDRFLVHGKWKDYSKDHQYVHDNKTYLRGFTEDDKKYLRVYYEVLERYPREKFKYEEDQIQVLKDIRDRMPETSAGPKK